MRPFRAIIVVHPVTLSLSDKPCLIGSSRLSALDSVGWCSDYI